jgi:hypothetical protein
VLVLCGTTAHRPASGGRDPMRKTADLAYNGRNSPARRELRLFRDVYIGTLKLRRSPILHEQVFVRWFGAGEQGGVRKRARDSGRRWPGWPGTARAYQRTARAYQRTARAYQPLPYPEPPLVVELLVAELLVAECFGAFSLITCHMPASPAPTVCPGALSLAKVYSGYPS